MESIKLKASISSPAQHGVQKWKAQISIRTYEQASSAVSGNSRPPHLTEEEIMKLIRISLNTPPASLSLTPRLCYACHTTLTSRSSRGTATSLGMGQSIHNVPTPMWVRAMDSSPTIHEIIADDDEHEEVSRNIKMTRTDMKAKIAEFLLPDE